MNLFADIRQTVLAALGQMVRDGALPEGLNMGPVTVEPPRDAAHGDMATNAAMVLAKPAGQKPRDIAEALAALLSADDRIESAEVAGPGFLNLRLGPDMWRGVVKAALTDPSYGRSQMGQGRKVMVEYVSANPTGPLHVGHTRGAVFGDALASLLDFAGWDVTREYYINDGGAQVDVLARSAYERYREACGQAPEIVEGLYPGDYLVPVGQAMKDKWGDSLLDKGEQFWLEDVREFATEQMMALIRSDLAALNVEMDSFYSEKSLYGTGRIESAIETLDQKGLIYRGTLEPPKGKLPEDWEAREQTLFRSTAFGDDVDRPVKKSDDSWTYFAPDIAYHYDKITRGFDALIDVFGADHGGYVKRMKAAVAALSDERVPLYIKLTQLVKLFKNGEEFKMSKRAGNFITLRDLIDEVGPDVTRFHMLMRKNDAPLDFDFQVVTEGSNANPIYKIQYANARICKMLRDATAKGMDVSDAALAIADLSLLDHEAQMRMIKAIGEFPRLVETAAKGNEPHRVAFYLSDFASEFNSLYTAANADPSLRVLSDGDEEATKAASLAKIALIRATSVVISHGLGILGVTPVEEMR